MIKYLFQLGRERALARAELEAVVPDGVQIAGAFADYLLVQARTPLPTVRLQERLGGTIQICRVVDEIKGRVNEGALITTLATILEHEPGRNFGLIAMGQQFNLKRIGLAVKQVLANHGRRRRWVAPQSDSIRSIVIFDQLLPPTGTALTIISADSANTLIGKIEAVQDVRAWSHRDYDRPARDPLRGMLPPKLARIMVNLAAPNSNETLLDPFCGVGTVLMEAALLGCRRLVGTDRDVRAIEASRLNFTWLRKELGVATNPEWVIADVAVLKQKLDRPVDVIVTEADLGPANISRRPPAQRITAMRELQTHYEHWLETFASLLAPDGRMILAYPELRQPQFSFDLEPVAKHLGFELLGPTLTYARPDQVIGRRILRIRQN